MLTLRGLGGDYREVFLPLFGAHQARNAALALAAVESFFGITGSPDGGGSPIGRAAAGPTGLAPTARSTSAAPAAPRPGSGHGSAGAGEGRHRRADLLAPPPDRQLDPPWSAPASPRCARRGGSRSSAGRRRWWSTPPQPARCRRPGRGAGRVVQLHPSVAVVGILAEQGRRRDPHRPGAGGRRGGRHQIQLAARAARGRARCDRCRGLRRRPGHRRGAPRRGDGAGRRAGRDRRPRRASGAASWSPARSPSSVRPGCCSGAESGEEDGATRADHAAPRGRAAAEDDQ